MAIKIPENYFATSGDVLLNLLKGIQQAGQQGLLSKLSQQDKEAAQALALQSNLVKMRYAKEEPYIKENGKLRPLEQKELLGLSLGVEPANLVWKPREKAEKLPVSYQRKFGAMDTYLGSLKRATNWNTIKSVPYRFKPIYGAEIKTTLGTAPIKNKNEFLNWVGTRIERNIYSKDDPYAIKFRQEAEKVWDKIVDAQWKEAIKTREYKKWRQAKPKKKARYLNILLDQYPAIKERLYPTKMKVKVQKTPAGETGWMNPQEQRARRRKKISDPLGILK